MICKQVLSVLVLHNVMEATLIDPLDLRVHFLEFTHLNLCLRINYLTWTNGFDNFIERLCNFVYDLLFRFDGVLLKDHRGWFLSGELDLDRRQP
jgi:hypothetical protein